MKYNEVIDKIKGFSEDTIFADIGSRIEEELRDCTTEEILEHLDNAGVIPESFGHDSTEEKVYAKYCDALLSITLEKFGFSSEVLEVRANAADVSAQIGSRKIETRTEDEAEDADEGNGTKVIAEAEEYGLVADSKAFRLSRTTKNPKDYKITALNQWRINANKEFSMLVCPYYQYLTTKSQIYGQAIRNNVTLLSYTHLAFLLRSQGGGPPGRLRPLLEMGKHLEENDKASNYWNALNDMVARIAGRSREELDQAITTDYNRLKDQGNNELQYWKKEEERIRRLDRDQAITELVKALKIDQKRAVINKTMSKKPTANKKP